MGIYLVIFLSHSKKVLKATIIWSIILFVFFIIGVNLTFLDKV